MSSDAPSGNGRPPTPFWLDAVRRFERAIGVPVERALTSDAYFDLMPVARRAFAQVEETVAGLTEDWYRLLNLPTGNDVRQLRAQISRMERQIEKLAKQLEDAQAPPKRPPARKRPETD